MPKDMKWHKGTPPEQFVRGIKVLPPGKTLYIPYFGVFELLKEKDVGDDPKFDIDVTYTHGETGQKLTETFHFEPADLRGTIIKQSDVEKQGRELCSHIRELTRAVEKLSQQVNERLVKRRQVLLFCARRARQICGIPSRRAAGSRN